jgi:hypothetical protein
MNQKLGAAIACCCLGFSDPAPTKLPQYRKLWVTNASSTIERILRIAKVVQMIKRGMLGVCDILLFAEANMSSGHRFDSEDGEGGGGSRASSICWQRGHGVVTGGFTFGEAGMGCPSTSQRIPAVVRKERKKKENKKRREVFAS